MSPWGHRSFSSSQQLFLIRKSPFVCRNEIVNIKVGVAVCCPRDIISAFWNLNKKTSNNKKINKQQFGRCYWSRVGHGILAAGEMSKVKDKWHGRKVITWVVLLKLEPTSDVLGKDFRWWLLDDTVESEDKPLRKRIEPFNAFPMDAFFAVSVAELEL